MHTLAFFGMPGHIEMIILLLIILLFFGKRLPNAMYSVGKSITEFKKGAAESNAGEEGEEDAEQEARVKEKQES